MKKFRAAYLCVNCREELTYSAVMYSNGVCPHCGHVNHGTVVAFEKVSIEIPPPLPPGPPLWKRIARKLAE